MLPIFVNRYTLTSALGAGLTATRESLLSGRSGLSNRPWPDSGVETWYGRVPELDDETGKLEQAWDSRNNRLARLGLEQDGFAERVREMADHLGPDRLAVILGTSTSSIGQTELAFRDLDSDGQVLKKFHQPMVHNPHSTGAFVADYLGITGPALTISTACSSSAKVFASASRMLEQNIVDAVIVGGVDSLCLSVIYGFHSLQLVSPNPCRPFDQEREGITLGEAAAFVLLVKDDADNAFVSLLGFGESSDAYHMSSAHPEGLGARLAIEAALKRSCLSPQDIDYLNLHGTGTQANDAVEGAISADLFSERTIASATKGWTGHALGAAGATEAIFCIDALVTQVLPGTINTRTPEINIADNLILATRRERVKTAMTNSFGFGGNNCSLVFTL
jgi:3-oxoacyl-[acyl-carrier-protein] synthase-1